MLKDKLYQKIPLYFTLSHWHTAVQGENSSYLLSYIIQFITIFEVFFSIHSYAGHDNLRMKQKQKVCDDEAFILKLPDVLMLLLLVVEHFITVNHTVIRCSWWGLSDGTSVALLRVNIVNRLENGKYKKNFFIEMFICHCNSSR